MKYNYILLIVLSAIFSIKANGQIAGYPNLTWGEPSQDVVVRSLDSTKLLFEGRAEIIPCTMLVSSLFATDGVKSIGDSLTGITNLYFANIFQIRGFMVVPEHSEVFYLDESKRRIILLHVWMAFPYNYHVPNTNRQSGGDIQFNF